MIRLRHDLHLGLGQGHARPARRLPQRRLALVLRAPRLRVRAWHRAQRAVQPVEHAHGAEVDRAFWVEGALVVQVVLARVVPRRSVARVRQHRRCRCRREPHVQRDQVRAPDMREPACVRDHLSEVRPDKRREEVEDDLLRGRAVPSGEAKVGAGAMVELVGLIEELIDCLGSGGWQPAILQNVGGRAGMGNPVRIEVEEVIDEVPNYALYWWDITSWKFDDVVGIKLRLEKEKPEA